MMRTYTAEQKAAVLRDFSAGSTNTHFLATKHGIPRSTIRNWTKGLTPLQVTPKTKEELDQRVLDLTLAGITAIENVFRSFTDPAFVKTQNAHDLALFVGITSDKLTAILAAYERGNDLRAAEAERAAGQLTGRTGDPRE